MCPVARLVELELRTAGDDLLAEGDECGDDVAQVERFGPAAADRQHVGRKRALRGRVPPQLVEHHFRRRVALQVDDDAHAFAVRFVANVADALDALVLGGFRDLLYQRVLALLVGDLGEHDRTTVAAGFLDLMARADDHRAAAGLVRRLGARATEDDAPRREVRPRHDLHQLFERDGSIVDIRDAGIHNLAEIVRRDVGGHAHRDAACAVDQEVGKARRQHRRFVLRTVVIGLEIDGILVEILHQVVGRTCQPRLGIAHRRGRIGIHRAEIALTIDQWQPHRPILGHARQRLVDRAVAVRVVFTDHVADDARRLAIRLVEEEPAFLRREENAAVHRLQAVAHVGQRARDDHRHGIVEVARLHFVDDGDRRNV